VACAKAAVAIPSNKTDAKTIDRILIYPHAPIN
jgi:hypothetical protein